MSDRDRFSVKFVMFVTCAFIVMLLMNMAADILVAGYEGTAASGLLGGLLTLILHVYLRAHDGDDKASK